MNTADLKERVWHVTVAALVLCAGCDGRDRTVYVSEITVTPATLELYVGEMAWLRCTVLPAYATDWSIEWSSDNRGVATVDAQTGVVTAVDAGRAVITAGRADGGKTAACDVAVWRQGRHGYQNEGNWAWRLDDNGTLRIRGKGRTADYSALSSSRPWDMYRIKINRVVIEEGITGLGDWSFYKRTGLTSVVIGKSVTAIGNGAFDGCSNLTSITFPKALTAIGNNAFDGCSSLTSITLPDAVKTIGEYAFFGCRSLTSIVLGDGIRTIGLRAFSDKNDGLVEWGNLGFLGENKRNSVTLGRNVDYIGNDAFSWAGVIRTFTILNPTPPEINHTVFYSTPVIKLCVPAKSVELYKNSEWQHIAVFIDGI